MAGINRPEGNKRLVMYVLTSVYYERIKTG